MNMRTFVTNLAMCLALLWLVGCTSGPRNFANENDRLRRENVELRDTVAELRDQTANLEYALAIERRRPDSPRANVPEGVQPPLVTRITVGRFSGGFDTDDDNADDAIRLYLNTLDARNRFVPTVGTVSATVLAIPPGEEAVTVATHEFDAQQLEDAYRSGFGGTHYTLVVPIEQTVPEGLTSLLVRIRLTDLLTGETHETEATVRWQADD